MKPLPLALLILPLFAFAADDDDARLLRDSERQQAQHYRQSDWLEQKHTQTDIEQAAQSADYIAVNGQLLRVGESEAELEAAVYFALNVQQWQKVAQLTERYRSLPNHKPETVLLAEGLIARSQHQHTAAIKVLEQAHQLAPQQPRIALELARLYTEDNQNNEAKTTFEQVLNSDMPAETRPIIQNYLNELDKRDNWHGSVSLGFGRNSNINQANGGSICSFELAGQCLMYQNFDKPIASTVINYSANAAQIVPIKHNHNLKLRGLAYGSHYRKQNDSSDITPDYSNYVSSLSMGYDYADARNHFAILPYFEHEWRNQHTHYHAWGAETEWSRNIGQKWRIFADADVKHYQYKGESRQYFSDYHRYDVNLGAEYAITPQTGLFAKIGYTRNRHPSAAASNREYTTQLGGYWLFDNGNYVNAMLLHRRSLHDGASLMLSNGQRRQDKQLMWLAAIGLRQWQFKGIYPELRFKRNVLRSNADIYPYRQNEVMLSLKYHF